MNDNFKSQLAALARDVKAICESQCFCSDCELWRDGFCVSRMSGKAFDVEAVCAAVEAYRKHKKPCAEMIDRALDIYTIEVEMLRGRASSQSWTPKQCAKYAAGCIKDACTGKSPTVRVLSAKRFVLESHREEEE